MKLSKNFLTIFSMMGIALFVINAIDVFLGYNKTHGKGFQILGLFLIVIGMIIWKIRLK